MNINHLKEVLSIPISNSQLFIQAFTHSSYVNEHQHKSLKDNERLEFLGDAVLELAISDYLFREHPKMTEGEMSKLRAYIVCEDSLFHFAEMLELQQFILLGKGEERTGGRKRQALLADVFEAFLGALYLDQGMHVCQHFLEQQVFPHITYDAFSYGMDFKTKLQEIVQQRKGNTLQYNIIHEKGPAHQREFGAEVVVNGKERVVGIGKSKKEAEQKAAEKMIQQLQKQL